MYCNCNICTGNIDFDEELCEYCGEYMSDCKCEFCQHCKEHWDYCTCDYCNECWQNVTDCECEQKTTNL